jgi:hypothetical protein
MLNRFLHARVRAFERRYGYDGSYMHELVELDRTGFLRFMQISSGLGQHAGCLPPAAFFAARLAAILHEDCGPCAQLVVDMALEAGVAPATLTALAAGRPDEADGDVVSARVYPVLKRAMGQAHACQRLRVGDDDIVLPGTVAASRA